MSRNTWRIALFCWHMVNSAVQMGARRSVLFWNAAPSSRACILQFQQDQSCRLC